MKCKLNISYKTKHKKRHIDNHSIVFLCYLRLPLSEEKVEMLASHRILFGLHDLRFI